EVYSVFVSTINGSGTFTMEVTKESKDTIFAKILQLVNQNQDNQTKATSIIQKYEPRYVNLVLISIILVIILTPLILDWTWAESIYKGLVLLVAASPCALAASTISVTLSTTSNLAKGGVLSKGSTYLSQLSDIKAISFDKTGTLTKGKPEVTDYYFTDSINEEKIIDIIVAFEKESNHQLANAILNKFEAKHQINNKPEVTYYYFTNTIKEKKISDIIVALEKESNHPLANAILNKFEAKNQLDIEVINQIGKGLTGDYNQKNYRIGKPTSFKNID